jgi:hypothetical protein
LDLLRMMSRRLRARSCELTIGGMTAAVEFADIIEAGLYQFKSLSLNADSRDQLLRPVSAARRRLPASKLHFNKHAA